MKLETWKPKTSIFAKLKFIFSNFKYALAVLTVILLILGSVKLGGIIREYLYWQKTKDIYTAAVANTIIDYSFLKPLRNWNVENLNDIQSTAAMVLSVNQNGDQFLFEKNADKILPIASLSKLITAAVALKNYDLSQKVTITQAIIKTESDIGFFRVGEEFTIEELLYSMLLESSNDAAKSLSELMGGKKFVILMNEEIKKMGLNRTFFVDSIGLDPDFSYQSYNYSTARDLAKLGQYLFEESKHDSRIAKLFEIAAAQERDIFMTNGVFHHKAVNTNKLLADFSDIIISKTGQTPLAGQCLLIIMPNSKKDGYLINVILGSNSRFEEMKKIIDWLNRAYLW